MVPPVTKTANKAIWPVLLEVVIFNIILAVAMNALAKSFERPLFQLQGSGGNQGGRIRIGRRFRR